MRYTYLFTQVSRFEDGNLVPINDEPYEFRFTFGKKIENFMGKSPDSTVLFTKDMWKEYPSTNKEILGTVCFSTPSLEGFHRPLVMTKESDKRAGKYEYKLVDENELKEGEYLSKEISLLTKTFVNGVKAINDDAKAAPWDNLKDAKVKYLMSYIRSYVYVQLLQDKDKKGKVRSEAYLKGVLTKFFALIPDTVIDKFDKALGAHDEVRSKLEGVPEGNVTKINTILESQGYFKSIDHFNHFIVLRDYILRVKNNFNHLVWVMYRSKIGMVSLRNVKTQLGAIFGFAFKVQDDCNPKNKKEILKEICRGDRRYDAVGDFLNKIYRHFGVKDLNKSYQAALCYMFQKDCHWLYLSSRFRYDDDIYNDHKAIHKEEFRDLCLRFWGITEPNTIRPNKCKKAEEKVNKVIDNSDICREIWEQIKKEPENKDSPNYPASIPHYIPR